MLTPTLQAHSDPRDSESPYGVLAFFSWDHDWNNHHFGKTEDLERAAQLIKDAGIRWVRMDFLWADLEPEQGQFDFERYDRILSILQKNDIKVLGILNYNPSWAAGDWNQAPDVEAYVTYARATVGHFKDRVRYWEIWNEPDHPTYWQPQDGLQAYCQLLVAASKAIREEDASARVVLGGLSKDFPFHLRTIYKLAGKEVFDVINIHPFVDPLTPRWKTTLNGIAISLKRVKAEFEDYDKPIWITEIGCPGEDKAFANKTWWLGKAPTEDEQAQWLKEMVPLAAELPGVHKVFWAFLRDTGSHFGNAIDSFGLLREDLTPKPAYDNYQDVARPDTK